MNLSRLFSDLYRNLSSKATDDDDMAIETVYLPNKFTLLTYIFTQIVVFCQLLGQVIVQNKIPHHFSVSPGDYDCNFITKSTSLR